jgi:hypothetical protein
MKRPQITPGPWKEARKSHFCIVGNGGTFVADMRPSASTAGISTPKQEANARAIAAVPALLEALGDFVRLAQNSPFGSTIEVHESYFEEARAALRLAGYEF